MVYIKKQKNTFEPICKIIARHCYEFFQKLQMLQVRSVFSQLVIRSVRKKLPDSTVVKKIFFCDLIRYTPSYIEISK